MSSPSFGRRTDDRRPLIHIAPPTDHFSEIILLGLIAGGVIYLLARVIEAKADGWDVAACLLVLQGIISAIKERWTQRSVDRMGQQLGNSSPDGGPSGSSADPLHVAGSAPGNRPVEITDSPPTPE